LIVWGILTRRITAVAAATTKDNSCFTPQPELQYANSLSTSPSVSGGYTHVAVLRLATVRLEYAGLPAPPVLICAEDVLHGKPDPEGYLKAAQRLGISPSRCVVVEDAPAGILAGRNAGMTVLALTTTFPAEHLLGAVCVPDLTEVEFFIA
jgi:Haloacid dehalogenase-like hydrolase